MKALPPSLQQWQARWRTLPRTRQHVLLALVAMIVAALGWALVYAPLQTSRTQNGKRIVQLQQDLARMQQDAAAYQQLKSLPPVVAATTNVALADVAGLEAVFGVGSKVSLNASGLFRIDSTAVRYRDWLGRLDQATARYRLNVRELDIRRGKDELFDISATLADKPKGDAK